jgi:hypothetical protein
MQRTRLPFVASLELFCLMALAAITAETIAQREESNSLDFVVPKPSY